MKSVRELEKMIVTEIQDLKGLESRLDQRFASLGQASPGTRASFLRGLMDLEERARGVEELIDALTNSVYRTALESAFI